MKNNKLDNASVLVLKLLGIYLICAFFYRFGIPPFVTCIFIALGYLIYNEFKK